MRPSVSEYSVQRHRSLANPVDRAGHRSPFRYAKAKARLSRLGHDRAPKDGIDGDVVFSKPVFDHEL